MAHWRQSGAGAGRAITNTTSPAGTNPLPGMRVVLAHIDDAALQSVAAYDVSKFGTVALTEVLAMESAAEGSTVGASVLVPGTVHTRQRHPQPPSGRVGGGRGLADSRPEGPDLGMTWIEPDDVGRVIIRSMAAGDLYVVTHPEGWPIVECRHQGIAEAFTTAVAAGGGTQLKVRWGARGGPGATVSGRRRQRPLRRPTRSGVLHPPLNLAGVALDPAAALQRAHGVRQARGAAADPTLSAVRVNATADTCRRDHVGAAPGGEVGPPPRRHRRMLGRPVRRSRPRGTPPRLRQWGRRARRTGSWR